MEISGRVEAAGKGLLMFFSKEIAIDHEMFLQMPLILASLADIDVNANVYALPHDVNRVAPVDDVVSSMVSSPENVFGFNSNDLVTVVLDGDVNYNNNVADWNLQLQNEVISPDGIFTFKISTSKDLLMLEIPEQFEQEGDIANAMTDMEDSNRCSGCREI